MALQARGNPLRDAASNSNRENQRPRQILKGSTSATAGTKRNALGNLTNQVRRQPVRAAKDKHSLVTGTSRAACKGQENEGSNEAKKSAFAVFQDHGPSDPPMAEAQEPDMSEMEVEDKENFVHQPILHDAVIGLNPGLVPPPSHVFDSTQAEEDITSPMVVDQAPEPMVEISGDEFGLDLYVSDIYTYMKSKEIASRPNPDYMNRQVDVSRSMRNILVDWLVEVCEEYKLHRETLFLAVNYIDRFLSLVGVQRPKLQLVGAACMFIAAKYEEIYPPEVGEFVYITDDTYTKAQVLKMESVILKLLDFKVAVPTLNWFCEHFLERITDMNDTAKHLTFYLSELSLIEIEEFLHFRSSVLAASCILLARSTMEFESVWSQSLGEISGYSMSDLVPCVKVLFKLYVRSGSLPQQAVPEKYRQEKFACVALLQPNGVMNFH